MDNLKLSRLKAFGESFLYKSLSRIRDTISKDFLSLNMHTKKEIDRRIDSITYCNEKSYIRRGTKCDDEGEIIDEKVDTLYKNECGQYLICPICARKRADLIKMRYGEKIKEMSKKYRYSYFVTTTIQDQLNFRQGWDFLTASMRRWRRQGQKRLNGKRYCETGKIRAALWCGEAKEGMNSRLWHLHFHGLVFTDELLDFTVYDKKKRADIERFYNEELHCSPSKEELIDAAKTLLKRSNGESVPVSKLSYEWYIATKCTSLNIDVEPLFKLNKDLSIKSKKEIEEVMPEVVKYASKINEISDDEKLKELLIYKDKKRFLSTWGELRGIMKEEDIEEEEEFSDLDYSIETMKYDIKNSAFIPGDDEDEKFALELGGKIDELKDFRERTNWIRHFKNRLLDNLRDSDFVTMKSNEDKLKLIDEIDTMNNSYRCFLRDLFRRVVKLNMIKCSKKVSDILDNKGKFYYAMFYECEKRELKKRRDTG